MNEQPINESTDELLELLELEIDDSLDVAVTRKAFRISLCDKQHYSIVINGISFPLEDINTKGAGVIMVRDLSFSKGMILSDCDLILGKYRFAGVDSEIVHITSIKGLPPIFGIRWLNMACSFSTETDDPKKIEDVCDALKRELLNDNDNENDNENGNESNQDDLQTV